VITHAAAGLLLLHFVLDRHFQGFFARFLGEVPQDISAPITGSVSRVRRCDDVPGLDRRDLRQSPGLDHIVRTPQQVVAAVERNSTEIVSLLEGSATEIVNVPASEPCDVVGLPSQRSQ
jgi:hypothetical protein